MAQSNDFFPSIGSIVHKPDFRSDEGSVDTADADVDGPLQKIESLCMKCGEQGATRMLLTSIPFFQQVIVMSFRCDHCGNTNNEIQSAGSIRPEGTVYTTRILTRADLNRQIVRSHSCAISIPEYELILPANRGQLTTVEGLIRDIVDDLSGDQPLRRIQDTTAYARIQSLIEQLKEILAEDIVGDKTPAQTPADKDTPMPGFTIKLDDPAGNSFIEFVDSMADPKWNLRTYPRTRQQNIDLGLSVPDDSSINNVILPKENSKGPLVPLEEAMVRASDATNEEIYAFPGVCSSCGHPLNTLMQKVVIPYFKDIFIMSTNCDICGYRDNEVKSGSAISEKGKRLTLKVENLEDLSRDILKSETAGFKIPEINLELHAGTLGGRFTTVEGILEQVYEELSEKVLTIGDSSTTRKEDQPAFECFLTQLKEVKSGARPFTLILDDPLANSHIQNLHAPDPDPNMEIVMYDRSWQQNEDLGLNDMRVEEYETVPNVMANGTP